MQRTPFLFQMRQASFRLGGDVVFEGTTWSVRNGEHWAVLGPAGGGKSLLLETVAGALPLHRGEFEFGFRVPAGFDHTDFIAHVSFESRAIRGHDPMSQSRWSSVGEEEWIDVESFLSYDRIMDVNPYEVTDRHDARRREHARLFESVLTALSLKHLKQRTVIALSNGERQRLQLAAALLKRPKLLLLDDPFSGMDTQSRSSFKTLLRQLRRQGICVIAATSHPEDLPAGFNRAIYVDNLQVRSIEILKSKPVRAPSPPTALRENSCTNGPAIIEMRNVSISYGPLTILKDFCWTVRAGERWALLGPNGSGKSTLLGLINGDHPQAYANDIRVLGFRSGAGLSIWDRKRDIGFASPELHLQIDKRASVFEVLVSGFFDTPELHRRLAPAKRALAAGILRKLDFNDPNIPWSALPLSRQRLLLIARAMLKSPRLLLLDEPCQAMDFANRQKVLKLVASFVRHHPQSALIYVTHRKEELPSCLNRVLRLKGIFDF